VREIAAGIRRLPNQVMPPPFRLMQIGSLFWQSRALFVAAKLDIATILGSGSLSVDEIAAEIPASSDALYRLMRLLVAMGIFRELSPRYFANNALSSCLHQDSKSCIRHMILMHNSPEMSLPWYQELENCVRFGDVPFETPTVNRCSSI
jgi:hypothetical protein